MTNSPKKEAKPTEFGREEGVCNAFAHGGPTNLHPENNFWRLRILDLNTPWFWLTVFYQKSYGEPWFIASMWKPNTWQKWWINCWQWEAIPEKLVAWEVSPKPVVAEGMLGKGPV